MQLEKCDYASPQILRFGMDGEIFSLICPPQPQDQVGAPGRTARSGAAGPVEGRQKIYRVLRDGYLRVKRLAQTRDRLKLRMAEIVCIPQPTIRSKNWK